MTKELRKVMIDELFQAYQDDILKISDKQLEKECIDSFNKVNARLEEQKAPAETYDLVCDLLRTAQRAGFSAGFTAGQAIMSEQ